jgi:SAM-dependent methyltransferase
MFLVKIIRKVKNRLKTIYWGKLKTKSKYIDLLAGKSGIEIGGPSRVFDSNGILPIYDHLKTLDNCNFSNATVWEGTLQEGKNFRYGKNKTGFQFIREASDLVNIENEKYDFLLSSHCLEHCANAIQTLKEWKRVVKKDGYLLILVPNKKHTFDHKRPLTTLQHFIEDENNGITEKDLTHLKEILELHDLGLDKNAGTFEQFSERSKNNFENRCLHHHTFTNENLAELITYCGMEIVIQDFHPPYHSIILTRKV